MPAEQQARRRVDGVVQATAVFGRAQRQAIVAIHRADRELATALPQPGGVSVHRIKARGMAARSRPWRSCDRPCRRAQAARLALGLEEPGQPATAAGPAS